MKLRLFVSTKASFVTTSQNSLLNELAQVDAVSHSDIVTVCVRTLQMGLAKHQLGYNDSTNTQKKHEPQTQLCTNSQQNM